MDAKDRSCSIKVAFHTHTAAKKMAKYRNKRDRRAVDQKHWSAYKCAHCPSYHLTSQRTRRPVLVPPEKRRGTDLPSS